MQLQELVSKFNTVPFLFAGSGVTRRYYGLPSWEELLQAFALRLNQDRFAYQAYKSKAEALCGEDEVLPMTASLIQRDFDAAWYANPSLRRLDERGLRAVEAGTSPFKAEVAAFIGSKTAPDPAYKQELQKLRVIGKKNLAGVITTNYDQFFESTFEDYKSFAGQDTLVFSPIQGIAEIYKIHGSISDPKSIVISVEDYKDFNDKGKYLAAKLMTIFMEYPIIFIGYSITDSNIRRILSDIVTCLPDSKFDKLQERFVFVEYKLGAQGARISGHSIVLGNRVLNMTKVTLEDFGLLYDALAAKKASIPVKILRRFKEDIYTYVVTSEPGPTMEVAPLDDPKLDENKLAISIGLQQTGELGLGSLVDADKWYRDVVTSEFQRMGFTYDQVLRLAFTSTFKGSNGKLPVWKALSFVSEDYPEIAARGAAGFDDIASNTIIHSRKTVAAYSSAADLWEREKKDQARALRLLNLLPEEKMNVDELEAILKELFDEDKELLSHATAGIKTDVRRLIRFYDFLKWGKRKDPQT